MATLTAKDYYRESQVTTSGPGQLLLLVYDGMLRFLAEGRRAMLQKNYEAQNNSIKRVQSLLIELLNTLDHSVHPELATNLDRIYRYLYDRLTHANVQDDEEALLEVARHLSQLREAWKAADAQWRIGKS